MPAARERSTPPFTTKGRAFGPGYWLLAVVMGTATLFLRRPASLIHPSLFAEDGPIFLKGAYLRPAYRSIIDPYNGYLHVALRIWAEITTALPAMSLALSYAFFSLVVAVLCYSIVLSTRMRWLLPSDASRGVVFVVLLLIPGVSGITGNLTNALWPIGVGLALLSLCDAPRTRRGRISEVTIVTLMALTGASSLLVAASFGLRYWRTRARHDVVVCSAIFLSAGVQTLTLLLSHQRSGTGLNFDVTTIVRATLVRVWGTLVVGEQRLASIASKPLSSLFIVACVSAVAVTIAALLSTPRVFRLQWLTMFGLAIASTAWSFNGDLTAIAYTTNAGRYFLLPMVLVV